MNTTLRQIRDLLSPRSRRRVWALLGLMLVGTAVESLSVGLVVPVLALISDPTWASRYPIIESALRVVGADSPASLAAWAMGSLVAVFFAKTLVTAVLKHAESRFAYTAQCDIAARLFSGYLRQPWSFHLQRNSAELIRNVTEEPVMFGSFMSALLPFVSELLVVVALTSVLFSLEPIGATIAIATLAGAAALFNMSVRSRVERWGEARQHLQEVQMRHLQQGVAAAKEIKLAGREAHFERLFDRSTRSLAHTRQRQDFVSALPRLWLEGVAITGIAALVVALVVKDHSLAATLPALGLFAAAAFRLLPSIARLMGCVHTMRFRIPSIGLLHQELSQLRSAPLPPHPQTRTAVRQIRIEGVSFRYPESPRAVLEGVSFTVSAGASVGIVGPSGTGKSTLVDIVLGLLTPSEGQVTVNGADIHDDVGAWQQSIGYVPQAIYLIDDSIRRNVALGLEDHEISEEQVWRALRMASLDEFVRSLPRGLDTVTGERGVRLSGGQRQRIGIARAMFHDPEVLILDEATSALDAATEDEVMNAVNALHGRKTVIVIAHRTTTISKCDVVYRVESGKLTECDSIQPVTQPHNGT
jgi:ABC-type multidrug transport system fused ATPase/permease subunit